MKGLPFPDGHFDVVHFRALCCGVSDTANRQDEAAHSRLPDTRLAVVPHVHEALRLTKQGGLIVSVDGAGLCQLANASGEDEDHRLVAPGFMRYSDLFVESVEHLRSPRQLRRCNDST